MCTSLRLPGCDESRNLSAVLATFYTVQALALGRILPGPPPYWELLVDLAPAQDFRSEACQADRVRIMRSVVTWQTCSLLTA